MPDIGVTIAEKGRAGRAPLFLTEELASINPEQALPHPALDR